MSNEQVEEYGMYVQRFWTAVKSRMQKVTLLIHLSVCLAAEDLCLLT